MPLLMVGVGACLCLSVRAAEAEGGFEATRLYTLETNCTVEGVPKRCQVEAFDGTGATLYRTTIDGERLSFRFLDGPGRPGAQIWDGQSRGWVALDKLSLDFQKRMVCLNGGRLCLVNPNYFASLKQAYPNLRSTLIVARFDRATGTLSAICYSREACDAGF